MSLMPLAISEAINKVKASFTSDNLRLFMFIDPKQL